MRLEGHMYSGLRNNNHCEIDMEKGVRTGIRITVNKSQILTNVKDSDDVFYRQCNNQGRINRHWKEYNLAFAAKNSVDDKEVMQITDIDIDSLQIAQVGPNFENFPTAEEQMTERSTFLLKRHTAYNFGEEESAFDVSRIFELNLAHELATEQKKNMKFVDKDD